VKREGMIAALSRELDNRSSDSCGYCCHPNLAIFTRSGDGG